jgi:signal peptidase I
MNLKFWKKNKPAEPRSFVKEWFNAIVFAVVAATLIRWTTVEAFVIPTPSMENSLLVGDFLFVSKFHYGTRTPRTPLQIPLTHQKIWGTEIPSYLPWIELPSYRFPGISEVKRGDAVVFNLPPLDPHDGMKVRPIDLKPYYVKRCVGVAGDRLEIRDQLVIINGKPLEIPEEMKFSYLVTAKEQINKRNMNRFDLDSDDYYFLGHSNDDKAIYKMFLTQKQVTELRSAPYILSVADDYTKGSGPESDIFPSYYDTSWNCDDYGPLLIPKEGMIVSINDSTLSAYGDLIRLYEGNDDVQIKDGELLISGKVVNEYTFKQDYFFMMGDNRHNSWDSRYWGFVPADHIVGKGLFIWMSIEAEADFLHKIRWSRLFTKIK